MEKLLEPKDLKIFDIDHKIFELAYSLLAPIAGKEQVMTIVKNAIFPFKEFVFKCNKPFNVGRHKLTAVGLMADDEKENEFTLELITVPGPDMFSLNCKVHIKEGEIAIYKNTLTVFYKGIREEQEADKLVLIIIGDCIAYISTICQIINRKDLTDRQEISFSKLNKKRKASGKTELRDNIKIVLKRSIDQLVKNTVTMHAVNANLKKLGKKRLHDVRSHIRLKNGNIEIVKAHKRGSILTGEVNSSYKIV